MNLIYITNVRMPTEKAHGIQMVKMCEAFAKAGVNVTFVVPKRVNTIKEDIFKYYGLERNFRVKRVASLDLIQVIPWLGYWLQSLSFLFFVFLYVLFLKRKDNILYTREYLISFLLKKLGFYVIYESHRIILKKKLFFYLASSADKIITNSKGVAEEFRENGFKYVLACPNGVDFKDFEIGLSKMELRKKKNLPLDKKIIMYTGNFYKWKGVDTIFETAKLLGNREDILFVLVGGSKEEVEKREVLPNVMLLGHKNVKEIPSYLKSADVLLLPNIPVSEESIKYTSPVKLAEYMASGVPIVASDMPSIRYVLNENNSVLVKPADPEALIRGIDRVSGDMSRQALIDVKEYTWDKRARRIVEFIGKQ